MIKYILIFITILGLPKISLSQMQVDSLGKIDEKFEMWNYIEKVKDSFHLENKSNSKEGTKTVEEYLKKMNVHCRTNIFKRYEGVLSFKYAGNENGEKINIGVIEISFSTESQSRKAAKLLQETKSSPWGYFKIYYNVDVNKNKIIFIYTSQVRNKKVVEFINYLIPKKAA